MIGTRVQATTLASCFLLAALAAGCAREPLPGEGSGAAPAVQAGGGAPSAGVAASGSSGANVLVAFFTQTGTTRRLAEAVAEGARGVAGTQVTLAPIDSVLPEMLKAADAVILGSPTHWANMATPMRAFIDSWAGLGFPARDRIGAAFATGGSSGGGKEMVVTSLLLAMLNYGLIVVGPVFNEGGFEFGNFGVAATTGPVAEQAVPETDLEAGRALGRRVAEVAAAIRRD